MIRRRILATLANNAPKLPNGYQQIEYIENGGNSYIDTGVKPTYQTRVVLDISDLTTVDTHIFGAKNADSGTASDQFSMIRRTSTTIRSDYFGTNVSANMADTITRFTIDKDANVTKINGVVAITNTAVSSGASQYNMYLFGCNTANDSSKVYPSTYKLYSCKIYDNDVLVRDYVPCTNPIGVKGLWDKVNEEFYALTPTGYTRLAYLESNGSDYIDTGYKPNSGTKVDATFQYLALDTTNWRCLFGARDTSSDVNAYGFWINPAHKYLVNIGTQGSPIYFDNANTLDSHRITIADGVAQLDGESVSYNSSGLICNHNLYLFATDEAGAAVYRSAARIYSFKIYDNDVLVRDFIPCTNPDGISGLWDSVNDVFYKLLPADYTKLDFIESDGTTYIDTGYKPNNNTRVVMDATALDSVSAFAAYFGVRENTYKQCISCFTTGSSNATSPVNNLYLNVGDLNSGDDAFININPFQRRTIDVNKNAVYVDGSVVHTFEARNFTNTINLYLFVSNDDSVPSYAGKMRLYSCQIYDNGTLVRDFIPAMNASGEAGLYDLKNDVWYALLPVAKPKVENKIFIYLYNSELVDVALPDGGSVTLLRHTGWVKATYKVTSKITVVVKEMNLASVNHIIEKDYTDADFRYMLTWVNDSVPVITSISPTEDDTYIYTF